MPVSNGTPQGQFPRPTLRLGFGCSGAWGMRWFSERKALRLLEKAAAAGVCHIDTGAFYCGGNAERRLGRALRVLRRDDLFVSTKTGTRFDWRGRPLKDFSAAHLRRDVEESLRRLDVERLDLLYLHGPAAADIEQTRETVARLKAEGKIARDGVCGAGAHLDAAVAADVDVVMGVYNLFHREHAAAFARARAKGMGVVAVAPLAQGLYRRDLYLPRNAAGFWTLARALFRNRPALARARSARAVLETVEGWTPAQLALAFVMANPDIDVAVTTTTNFLHLSQSLGAAAAHPLAPDVLARLAALDARSDGA